MKRTKLLICIVILIPLWILDQGQIYGQKSETVRLAKSFYLESIVSQEIPDDFHFDIITQHGSIWVFETVQSPSFILVKEEELPIIAGYSFDNLFHKDGIVIEPAQLALEKIQSSKISDYSKKSRLKTFPDAIEPMLASKWDQNSVTNYFCPEDTAGPGDRVSTGCVAVAMGQIVRHFNKWNTFFFESSYNAGKYGILKDNVGGYNWEKIEDRPICISLEVSRLLYHMGLVTKMGYGGVGSSTSNFHTYAAFKNLGYLSVGRMLSAFTDTEKWINEFYRNISEYKPLLVTGWGHAYVCDGYDSNGLFHFNLGWGGVANGYYPLLGYGSFPSSEAFVDIIPWSRHYPPVNLRLHKNENGSEIRWNTHKDVKKPAIKYRVYSNEKLIAEVADSTFDTDLLGSGTHRLQVTSFYTGGESTWIGPVTIHNKGDTVVIADPGLRLAINKAIGIKPESASDYYPRLDEIQFVEKIEIEGIIESLEGIELCQELKVLTIHDNGGQSLDLAPLAKVKNLRILELANLEPINLADITQNSWLIKLHLKNVDVIPFDELTDLQDLISFKISGVPVQNINALSQFPLLKTVQLNNIGIEKFEYFESMQHLSDLDLSENSIERLNIKSNLSNLRSLNLEGNEISQVWFIDKLSRIESLNLSGNNINDLIMNHQLSFLKSLNISNNGLDSVWITRDLPELEIVDFSNNEIGNIDRLIFHAPKLVDLNLANNRISGLWPAGLQKLERLDLSKNQISLIGPIINNPSLKYFNISDNSVGDFYPLLEKDLYKQLIYLNTKDNPVSIESYQEFFPVFASMIPDFKRSSGFEAVVPCYPSPTRNSLMKEDNVSLSWSEAILGEERRFDVYFGSGGNLELLAEGISENQFQVPVKPNESYSWQVRSHSADTSFVSGLFNFQTFHPINLPFRENFESFQPFQFMAVESPFWRTETNMPGSGDDAQIVNIRSFEGENSLRMIGNSKLALMVSDFNSTKLVVNLWLYIESNSHGVIRLVNLNGSDLSIYFKSNRKGDVIYNGKLICQFFYSPRQWTNYQIFISGPTKAMYIRMDDRTIVNEKLAFTQGKINFEGLEFSTEDGIRYPTDGFPLFFIDDLYVSNFKTTGINDINTQILPDIKLYPNPVDDILRINSGGNETIDLISIYSSDGRLVMQHIPQKSDNREIELDLSAIKPGIYMVVCTLKTKSKASLLLIN